MNQWKLILLLGICACFIAGCDPKKPDGVPDLFPAAVTVIDANAPIADANVFLVLQGGVSGSWAAHGRTNASGLAVINTSQGDWSAQGAPAGDYKVFVTKVPDVELEQAPEAISNDSDALERFAREQAKKLQAAPKIIPEPLTSPATSPLKLTVVSGSTAELRVDVDEHK